MARTLKSDKTLFLSTLLLVGVSVVMVYSASAVQAVDKGHSAAFFLMKQLAWAVIGVLLMLGAMRIDYHEYRRPALIWSLLGVTVFGLLAVFLFQTNQRHAALDVDSGLLAAAVRAGEARRRSSLRRRCSSGGCTVSTTSATRSCPSASSPSSSPRSSSRSRTSARRWCSSLSWGRCSSRRASAIATSSARSSCSCRRPR